MLEFLLVFLLGGLTLIPISLAALIGLIFYTSPIEIAPLRKSNLPPLPLPLNDDETAPTHIYRAGWLTVRRTYEALEGADGGTYVGMMVSGYRSFMDNRSRDPRRNKPKDSFFAVLRQNVLYLYDNEERKDCWAAVDLSLHGVIIYPEETVEGELFVRRNAICLRPKFATEKGKERKAKRDEMMQNAHAASEERTHDMEPTRMYPWFIFAKVNADKEDWFHDLIKASKLSSPTTNSTLAQDRLVFDSVDMNRLIEGIDQQPDSIPVRWLNAMFGRLFLGVYRTATLEDYIISRIVRKLKRVKTPSILSEIQVREVDVGSTAPFFTKPMLKELTADGVASMEVKVSYVGEVRITIETVATINLGSHFKPYAVRLVLAVILKELEGTLLLKFKPPPSNRVWFGFSAMPRMVLSVEPVVSTRKINWSMITSPIESRIREVILESIVVPNMDDFPFFDSSPFDHRGGIFGDALRRENDLTTTEKSLSDVEGPVDLIPAVSESVEENDSMRKRGRKVEGEKRAGSIRSSSVEKGVTGSSSSSLAGFSIAAWSSRESKGNEKKKSWFPNRVSTLPPSTISSTTATPPTTTTPLDDSPTDGTNEITAARLRDVLQKRAKEREGSLPTISASSRSTDDLLLGTPASLSALSLTAPKTSSSSSSVESFTGSVERPPSIVVSDEDRSPSQSLPNDTVLAASAASANSLLTHPNPTAPPLPSRPSFTKTSDLPPPPPRRLHQTATSIDSSNPSSSTNGFSIASAASTASILNTWRNKASDKQAIVAGVANAKEGLKRWGATWNSKGRTGGNESGGESDSSISSSRRYDARKASASPSQDFGHTTRSSRGSTRDSAIISGSASGSLRSVASREGSRDRAGESYKDYLAGKVKSSAAAFSSSPTSTSSITFPSATHTPPTPSIVGTTPSEIAAETGTAPIPISSTQPDSVSSIGSRKRDKSISIIGGAAEGGEKGSRRISISTSPGHFIPPASGATTKVSNTTTSFSTIPSPSNSTAGKIPKSISSPSLTTSPVPSTDIPLPSTSPKTTISVPPTTKAYQGSKMMSIPGIREPERKSAVAGDHVEAVETEAEKLEREAREKERLAREKEKERERRVAWLASAGGKLGLKAGATKESGMSEGSGITPSESNLSISSIEEATPAVGVATDDVGDADEAGWGIESEEKV